MKMAEEELRLVRSQIMKVTKELTVLYCELEDVEIELDRVSCLEVETYEGIRRASVGRIERRLNDAKARRVRVERCRWKTEAIRLNVIQRNRAGYQKIVKAAKEGRNLEYAQTVSFEVRQQRRDYEQLKEKHLHHEDGMANSRLSATYESYAKPVDDTYNSIMTANTKPPRALPWRRGPEGQGAAQAGRAKEEAQGRWPVQSTQKQSEVINGSS